MPRDDHASRPLSLRLLKSSFNAAEDGLTGLQQLSHDATLLFYMTEEGQEGRDSYKERRAPGLLQVPEAALNPRIWLMAARPRTLPAAIAPVLVGSAAAWWYANDVCDDFGGQFLIRCDPNFRWGAFVAALIGSIFIQIGTNLANDYSDAKRGADTADRLGPVRVTSSGLVAPRRVLYATWLAFGVAVVAGHLPGDRRRLGDHRRRRAPRSPPASSTPAGRAPTATPAWASCSCSCSSVSSPSTAPTTCSSSGSTGCRSGSRSRSACCRPRSSSSTTSATSTPTGGPDKRTLAVRLGRARTRTLYEACVGGAFVVLAVGMVAADGPLLALLGLFAAPLAIRPLRAVLERTDGPALNAALAGTGALLGAFSVLVSLGLLIAA